MNDVSFHTFSLSNISLINLSPQTFLIKIINQMNKNTHTQRNKIKSLAYNTHNATLEPKRTILPNIHHHCSRTDRSKDFNKYYISPELRYKPKIQNPKQDPQIYEDQTYIYRNLHNQQFWNWVHPLSEYRLRPANDEVGKKVSITALEKFKHYMEEKTNKRVPNIVREILNHHSE